MDGDDVMRLRAADMFIMLGDISLETGTTLHTYPTLHLNLNLIECATAEKFECAITDYTTGLELNIQLFPLSSRQLAEAHYKPGIRAHDADLAKLVGRTNVHIFLVPR